MTAKRLILVLITILSLIPVSLNLAESLQQPQVQKKLEIYLTDIALQATEFDGKQLLSEKTADEPTDWRSSFLGKDPYAIANKQYLEAGQAAEKNLKSLQKQFKTIDSETAAYSDTKKQQKVLKQEIEDEQKLIKNLNLRRGIIQARLGDIAAAKNTWKSLINSLKNNQSDSQIQETAKILIGLWSQPPKIPVNAEQYIDSRLKGWFRYLALDQLYQIENRQSEILVLQDQEQKSAKTALLKLIFLNSIPLLGGAFGVGIILFLLIQLAMKKRQALIALNYNLPWKTPWGAVTIWEVLIVGFFFWGQIILPIVFLILGNLFSLSLADLNLRGKAIYILFNYFTLAVGGISVLYFSLKSFLPLDQDWFRFKWLSNWFIWGIGGYLVALPMVLLISLINQQIWGGQGGSNPLLFLALETQDWFALSVFFFTASIAAPFYEEIMFRGFLLPSLTRYIPVWGAILTSSLIFAIAHQNLSEILPLFVLGIILGITYTRSRNLLASILLHSLWNSGTLLSLFLLGSS
jgi:membrane protease YdiL (CAAX protease family)